MRTATDGGGIFMGVRKLKQLEKRYAKCVDLLGEYVK